MSKRNISLSETEIKYILRSVNTILLISNAFESKDSIIELSTEEAHILIELSNRFTSLNDGDKVHG